MEENQLEQAHRSILLIEDSGDDRSFLESAGYAIGTSVISAGSQLADIPTSVGNLFVDDYQKEDLIDIEGAVYDAMGADAADYYEDNKEIIDVVGFAATSMIPGMAGVKALHTTQKFSQAALKGKDMHPFYKAALRVVTPKEQLARAELRAASTINNASHAFKKEGWKAIGQGAHQQLLEATAFELMAVGALREGEVLHEESLDSIVKNMIWGAGLGAGFGTAFTAARVAGIGRKAVNDNRALVNEFSVPVAVPEGLATSETALFYLRAFKEGEAEHAQVFGGGFDAVKDKFEAGLGEEANKKLFNVSQTASAKRLTGYKNDAVKALNEITEGDNYAAELLFDRLKSVDFETTAIDNFGGIEKFVPLGKATKVDRKAKAQKESLDVTTKLTTRTTFVDAITGAERGDRPKYISIQDGVGKVSVLRNSVVVNRQEYKVTSDLATDIDPLKLSAREHEARALFLSKKKTKFFTKPDTLQADDIQLVDTILVKLLTGELKHTDFEDSVVSLRQADKTVVEVDISRSIEELKEFQAATKRKVIEDYKKTHTKASLDEIKPAFNVNEDFLGGDGTNGILYRQERFASLPSKHQENKTAFAIPYHYKLTRDLDAIKADPHEVRGAATLMETVAHHHDESEAISNRILGEAASTMPEGKVTGDFMQAIQLHSDAIGTGAHFLASSNADYGTLGSLTKFIGQALLKAKEVAVKQVEDTLSPHTAAMIADPKLARSWSLLNAKVRSLPGKFVLSDDSTELILQEVDKFEKVGGTKPAILDDPTATTHIMLDDFYLGKNEEELLDILETHIGLNSKNQSDYMELSNVKTGRQSEAANMEGVFYPIPVDPDSKPYYLFAFDKRVATGSNHTHMLYASTPEELEELKQRIVASDLGQHIDLKSPDEVAEYYKSIDQVDLAKAVTSKRFSDEFIRRGLDSPLLPETDPATIANSLKRFHANRTKGVLTEATMLKYSAGVNSLTKMAKQHDEAVRSTKSRAHLFSGRKPRDSEGNLKFNPYDSYIAEMLGESNMERYSWWKKANDTVSDVFQKLHDNIFSGSTRAKPTYEDLDNINAEMTQAGFANAFVAPLDMHLANNNVSKGVASKFVADLNSVLGFFILRTDPMHAGNNLLGHNILYNAELKDVLNAIAKKDPSAGVLNLLNLDVPGGGKVLSHANIYKQAMADFWGDNDLRKMYTDMGYNLDISSQVRQLLDDVAIKEVETTGSVAAKSDYIRKKMASGALKLENATGNKFSEEFTTFIAARSMHIIAEEAVKQGILSPKSMHSYINTFVNRVRGTYLASQRPALFQGPIGQSMALFQTYQLNLMQQLFRYMGKERSNTPLYMMGLQSSIYGMNGLPGYSAINTHVVGQAAGNENHHDITGSAYRMFGDSGADWLMYGLSANMLSVFDDDLATNIYTRGDLNPRHLTIVPVNPLDAPWVAGWSKFLGNLKDTGMQLANGGDAYTTILNGLEHNGLSRPLSGLARTMKGMVNENGLAYSTTKSGNLVASYDWFSLASLVGIAGGRTLTEARSLDALYKAKAYDQNKREKMSLLRERVKSHTAGNTTLTDEEYEEFVDDFAANGGDLTRFRQFLMSAMKDANESTLNTVSRVNSSNYGRDMQAIMGGSFRDLYGE